LDQLGSSFNLLFDLNGNKKQPFKARQQITTAAMTRGLVHFAMAAGGGREACFQLVI
jgi:hypothetical protein